MKNKLNIFCNKKIRTFLNLLIPQYELIFLNLNDINRNLKKTQINIIIINNDKDASQVVSEALSEAYLIISNLKVKKYFEYRFIFPNYRRGIKNLKEYL